ncbi:polysialyltransferase family glycosyltransferase [Streptomyces sp. NPDC059009]|uniref:polysialyltransferase family glycosyltransferase n=1 Tax=Streptomyces sp. NPDC059009 TaxID=3346694 RepID=UPI0036C787F4
MSQVFAVSTGYGAATLAAALDAGLFGGAGARPRILLVTHNAGNPEVIPPPTRLPGFERLRARFDRVAHWNEIIHPHHPAAWSPRAQDVPAWQRLLRTTWLLDADEPVELVLESIQTEPARAIAALFPDSPVDLYADGLMSYGPTRNALPHTLHGRIRRLLHPDLVPGLWPLLLSEHDIPTETVPDAQFTAVLDELAFCAPSLGEYPQGAALILGQYLAATGILTETEEHELYARMVRAAAAHGHRQAVFKPHPAAPPAVTRALHRAADDSGITLTVCEAPVLAESLVRRLRPALVVGCFSTALLTTAVLHRVPTATVGTDLLLERLTPYENSNRIPATLARALLPDLEHDTAAGRPVGPIDLSPARIGAEVEPLLAAVGHCMQPQRCAHLREQGERFLAAHSEGGLGLDAATAPYFKRRRLRSLGLPGAPPPSTPTSRLLAAARHHLDRLKGTATR